MFHEFLEKASIKRLFSSWIFSELIILIKVSDNITLYWFVWIIITIVKIILNIVFASFNKFIQYFFDFWLLVSKVTHHWWEEGIHQRENFYCTWEFYYLKWEETSLDWSNSVILLEDSYKFLWEESVFIESIRILLDLSLEIKNACSNLVCNGLKDISFLDVI